MFSSPSVSWVKRMREPSPLHVYSQIARRSRVRSVASPPPAGCTQTFGTPFSSDARNASRFPSGESFGHPFVTARNSTSRGMSGGSSAATGSTAASVRASNRTRRVIRRHT